MCVDKSEDSGEKGASCEKCLISKAGHYRFDRCTNATSIVQTAFFDLRLEAFSDSPTQRLFGDSNFIRTRWLADPSATLGAELNGSLVGSNFVTRWGSVGFFGPLTVHPSFWEHGIAKKLLAPTVDMLNGWQVAHAGLFTFGHSPKHAALYQKFDFWPRFLTMLMFKPVAAKSTAMEIVRFSAPLTRIRC